MSRDKVEPYDPRGYLTTYTHNDQIFCNNLKIFDLEKYLKILEDVLNGGTINKHELRRICEYLINGSRNTPLVTEIKPPCTVIGDFDGRWNDLMHNLIVGGGLYRCNYLFMGNFIGLNGNDLRVIIFMLLLKLIFPMHVTIIRGINEMEAMMRKSKKLVDEIHIAYDEGDKMLDFIIQAFNFFPYGAVIRNKGMGTPIYAFHGGYPNDSFPIRCLKNQYTPAAPDLQHFTMNILCNEPMSKAGKVEAQFKTNPFSFKRGKFGPRTIHDNISGTEVRFLLRANNTNGNGLHVEHEGKVVTISSKTTSDSYNFDTGAILYIDEILNTFISKFNKHNMQRNIDIDLLLSGKGGIVLKGDCINPHGEKLYFVQIFPRTLESYKSFKIDEKFKKTIGRYGNVIHDVIPPEFVVYYENLKRRERPACIDCIFKNDEWPFDSCRNNNDGECGEINDYEFISAQEILELEREGTPPLMFCGSPLSKSWSPPLNSFKGFLNRFKKRNRIVDSNEMHPIPDKRIHLNDNADDENGSMVTNYDVSEFKVNEFIDIKDIENIIIYEGVCEKPMPNNSNLEDLEIGVDCLMDSKLYFETLEDLFKSDADFNSTNSIDQSTLYKFSAEGCTGCARWKQMTNYSDGYISDDDKESSMDINFTIENNDQFHMSLENNEQFHMSLENNEQFHMSLEHNSYHGNLTENKTSVPKATHQNSLQRPSQSKKKSTVQPKVPRYSWKFRFRRRFVVLEPLPEDTIINRFKSHPLDDRL